MCSSTLSEKSSFRPASLKINVSLCGRLLISVLRTGLMLVPPEGTGKVVVSHDVLSTTAPAVQNYSQAAQSQTAIDEHGILCYIQWARINRSEGCQDIP